jgi:serine/threonine protein kinase
MEFIHSAGFVYRDLKQAILLIGERDRCRIGDFGTSKVIKEKIDEHTLVSAQFGVPHWSFISIRLIHRIPMSCLWLDSTRNSD